MPCQPFCKAAKTLPSLFSEPARFSETGLSKNAALQSVLVPACSVVATAIQ
jgi:hypothetical protein